MNAVAGTRSMNISTVFDLMGFGSPVENAITPDAQMRKSKPMPENLLRHGLYLIFGYGRIEKTKDSFSPFGRGCRVLATGEGTK